MPPKGGQSSDVGSGTRGSVDKCKEHKSILTTTDIDYLSGSVTPQCFEIVRLGQKWYRLSYLLESSIHGTYFWLGEFCIGQ